MEWWQKFVIKLHSVTIPTQEDSSTKLLLTVFVSDAEWTPTRNLFNATWIETASTSAVSEQREDCQLKHTRHVTQSSNVNEVQYADEKATPNINAAVWQMTTDLYSNTYTRFGM